MQAPLGAMERSREGETAEAENAMGGAVSVPDHAMPGCADALHVQRGDRRRSGQEARERERGRRECSRRERDPVLWRESEEGRRYFSPVHNRSRWRQRAPLITTNSRSVNGLPGSEHIPKCRNLINVLGAMFSVTWAFVRLEMLRAITRWAS
jgi:hypothetical protein